MTTKWKIYTCLFNAVAWSGIAVDRLFFHKSDIGLAYFTAALAVAFFGIFLSLLIKDHRNA